MQPENSFTVQGTFYDTLWKISLVGYLRNGGKLNMVQV